jgi:hypothetical protein
VWNKPELIYIDEKLNYMSFAKFPALEYFELPAGVTCDTWLSPVTHWLYKLEHTYKLSEEQLILFTVLGCYRFHRPTFGPS